MTSDLQFGAVFPQFEIGDDMGVVRSFFETVEGLGFRHVLAYDHVLGVGRSTRPGWNGLYDSTDAFHEPAIRRAGRVADGWMPMRLTSPPTPFEPVCGEPST